MISHPVTYVRPEGVEEAVQAWHEAAAEGLEPLYLGGGSEILTMARENRLRPRVLIDLKRIARLRRIEIGEDHASFGAALKLNDLVRDERFALLGAAAGRVADYSVRNGITLGGNVCGMLPYREAVLPFLAGDGTATVAGVHGQRVEPLSSIFVKRLRLKPGELLVELSVSVAALSAPWFYRRRERDSRVDYPLLTLCAVAAGGELRLATSGAFGFPLRSPAAEAALAASDGTPAERAATYVAALPGTLRADMRASAEYRRALLIQAVEQAVIELDAARPFQSSTQ